MIYVDLSLLNLFGFICMLGILNLKTPVEENQNGKNIRLFSITGLLGLSGFWINGAGALGAFGAYSLWNHQILTYKKLSNLGVFGILGLPNMLLYFI